ncbi:MAG: hypothetical protein IJ693_03835 [Bacteroidaceae bacterium]|nr:hypothetical protein [Bacteroidaceae bacterium]
MTLLTTCGLQSCSTSDSDEPIKKEGIVTVDVVLNVSAHQKTANEPNGADTRMPASSDVNQFDVTQTSGKFRGVQELRLYPMASEEPVSPDYIGNLTRQGDTYNYLSTHQVELSIGTSSFLCYGRAIPFTENNEVAKFKNGFFNAHYDEENPLNSYFDPEPIYVPDNKAQAIATYLTNIATAGHWNQVTDENETLSELRDLFKKFVNLNNTGEYSSFAGSSRNIKAMVSKLYQDIAKLNYGTGSEGATLQRTILSAITTGVTFDTNNHEVTNLGTTMDDYPTHLPDGAAVIQWNKTTSQFEPILNQTAFNDINSLNRFVYPAELYYFKHSSIKTSASSEKEHYNLSTWSGESGVLHYYENDNAEVTTNTLSVAIKEPLDYAVGCLKTYIKATSSTLKDANEDLTLQDVTLDAGTFPLTGILIGGQTRQGYNFEPQKIGDQYDEYIIYDPTLQDESVCLGAVVSQYSSPLFTLALQTQEKKPVKLVLEFLNNSKDFVSENGIIYKGTKFYLVASINVPATPAEDFTKRVFTKDYITEVHLDINNLTHAYNALPSLDSDNLHIFNTVQAGIQEWKAESTTSHSTYNW